LGSGSREHGTFAVVFDFDGTVLDTESAAYESHCRFFAEHSVDLPATEWCSGIGIIQPERHWFDWLCARAASPPTFERFKEATRQYYRECVRMEPMPGILTLLEALEARGLPRAIGSNAPSDWVTGSLGELGLLDRFTTIVTGDQVERYKPAPDIYLEAARRLGIEPGHCIAIEDSGPGLASARAAGLKTIAIPHPLNRTHDLSGADLYVSNATELSIDRLQRLVDGPLL
jgi:HAD superfamily hydrolase (TIGR01509 family)